MLSGDGFRVLVPDETHGCIKVWRLVWSIAMTRNRMQAGGERPHEAGIPGEPNRWEVSPKPDTNVTNNDNQEEVPTFESQRPTAIEETQITAAKSFFFLNQGLWLKISRPKREVFLFMFHQDLIFEIILEGHKLWSPGRLRGKWEWKQGLRLSWVGLVSKRGGNLLSLVF